MVYNFFIVCFQNFVNNISVYSQTLHANALVPLFFIISSRSILFIHLVRIVICFIFFLNRVYYIKL